MIPYMTPESIKNSFTQGEQISQRPPDSIHWNPPVLITRTEAANTMDSIATQPKSKKLRHVNFSYTFNAEKTYKSASLAGTRKTDIPNTTKLFSYAAAVAGTPSSVHHGSIVSTMSEDEILKK